MRHPARAGRLGAAAAEQTGEIAAPEVTGAGEAPATEASAAAAVEQAIAAPLPAAASPEPDPVSIEIESVQASEPEPAPEIAAEPAPDPVRAPLLAAEPEGSFEPKTTELQRPPPAPSSLLAELTTPAPDLLDDPSAVELSEVEDTIPLALTEAFPRDRDEAEVKTRPKIRLPDVAPKRPTPPPPRPSQPNGEVALAQARLSSSVPPKASPRNASPLPPAPTPAGQAAGAGPSGEGIVRSSPPPPRPITASFDRDSEVPTRPRIPLTHDMALAAGRITSQDVTPFNLDDSLAATRPRLPRMPANRSQTEDPNPAVIVSRAQVISDRPPTGGDPMDRALGRPSRKPRPDSEEFETLDIEDGVEESSRLEITNGSANTNTTAKTLETGVRVSRTPPPPPSQPQARRPGSTGQHAQQRPAPPPPPPAVPAKKPAAAPQQKPARKRAWWEVLFSDDYVRTLPRPSSAAVAKQVSFMEASLGIKRGDAVLDVGCGLGQHALEFARRGYLVVALDLALSMITRAAEEAQQRGLRINFLHKDIRDIGFEGTFDAIICVGTTFGFFDDEQNKNVLQRLAHALKPGGRLLLDVVNRDFVIGSQPNLVWFEGDGCVVMEESDFNFYSSRLNVKRTMMREDGRQSDSEYSIRLYSVHELGQLLKQAGFSIKEVSGQEATRGIFFGAQSTRVIMLAERRANARNSREGSTPPGSDES